ncbi:ribonuclease E/G [Ahrensia sp. R2A130]|uniref:Rne/Rng family ribonuclease n=1 Tax=Ahrensia sp. R2A130 TaxID=744979 RepID=UPI0001E0E870|nr:ribonuclease E/G [Ahrensia sp. R2A130]EFL90406.1 ribonuclease E [Ahrensia sp. R2A130]
MANNKMLIDAGHPEETRVAIVKGNQVAEFDFESEHKTQIRGNIYLAKVTRVEPSLQAAFVDYGGNRHGFLAFSEVHPDYYQIPVADRQALIDAEAEDARNHAAREAEADAAIDQQDDQSDDDNDSDSDDNEVEAAPKTRKRRSRRRSPRNEETSEESDDSDAELNADNEGEDVVSEEAAPAEKPKRKRAAPKKKAAAEEAEAPTADEAEKPKRRRTTRKAPVATEETTETTEASEAETEEKPKRRRAPRKKVVAEDTAADVQAEAAPEADAAEEKPKRRRTSRKKAEPEVSEETADVAAEPAADAEAEDKPKRRRTSRTKKATPDEAVAEEATTETGDDETAQETKPRRRRSRKSAAAEASNDEATTDDEAVAEASDGDDSDAEEKPRSRRGRGRGRGGRSRGRRGENNGSEDETSSDAPVEEVGSPEDALEEVPARRAPRRHYKIQEVIKRRQILLVQVVKEERGNKGAALTTYLSLAGRYSVLMPNTARGGGISRKITNSADRKRLKSIATSLEVPQGMGVILRTAGASRERTDVERDFEYLMRLWENVRTLTLESTAPCLVYEEGSLIKRSIRDLYDHDTGEILVAGEAGYKEARDFMSMLMPSHAQRVKLYSDRIPLFARMGVEAQLDAMLQPQVTLKSGGYIIIDQTEALVAIDVNSGRSTRQHSVEETAVNTNLEAADEVARQLRLRDLAGLIVIDFIDMDDRRNVRAVEKRLKDALKQDRARIQVGRISHFGLMEMSRQRIRASVLESTTQICTMCEGLGHVRSSSSVVLSVLRAVEEHLNRSSANDLTVKVSSATALYMLNGKRDNLSDLEARFGVAITVATDESLGNTPCAIEKGELSNRTPVADTAVHPDTIEVQADDDTGNAVAETPSDEQPATERNEDGEGTGKKRRRRRRRGGRGRDDNRDENGEAKASEEGANAQSGDAEAQSEPTSDDEGEAPQRPARTKRSRRKPKAEAETASEGQAVTENTAAEDASTEEDVPKPTGRRTRKAPVAEVATEAVSEEAVAEAPPAEAEPAKPARRTSRLKAPIDTAEEAALATETASVEPPAATAEAPEDDTPKKSGWWQRKFF